MKRIIILLLAVSFGLTACNKDNDYEAQLAIDKEIIENYLADKGLTAQSTATGLYYIIDNPGTGEHPTVNSTVTVRYTGKFLSGTVFDSGEISYSLASLIEGWQIGIPLFSAGGSGTLFIPSGLGYGPTGSGSIAPNTVLIFDMDLISFQ